MSVDESAQTSEMPDPAERAADIVWMRRALEEAALAKPISPPNPSVGAVIVRDGLLLGRGHTQKTGGAHAEVMAVRDAEARGHSVEGATLYVTLEPCSHYGRTPPCALMVVEKRFARVVSAAGDPNPKVSGRGLAMIAAAGIRVTTGVLEEEAVEMNRGFMTRMTRGTPWVRMKSAVTLDGRTALPDGRSFWITGEAAREDGRRWRSYAGAVITGSGTVMADDPLMSVRIEGLDREPLRVVVDRNMKTPPESRIYSSPGGPVLLVCAADSPQRALYEAKGVEVLVLPDPEHPADVDLRRLLIELASRDVNEVHLEAGERLSGAFLREDLVDELLIYEAPCFFGCGRGPAVVSEPESPGAARRWRLFDVARTGNDVRIICRRN